MDYLILALILIGFLSFIGSIFNGSKQKHDYAYQKSPTLLTPAERSFFGVLNTAVGESSWIFAKVRVADILTPLIT